MEISSLPPFFTVPFFHLVAALFSSASGFGKGCGFVCLLVVGLLCVARVEWSLSLQ